jgi:hypothetical protein
MILFSVIGSDAERQEALVITANPGRSHCLGSMKGDSFPCVERPDNNLSIPAEPGQYCTGQLTLRTVGLYYLSSAMVSQQITEDPYTEVLYPYPGSNLTDSTTPSVAVFILKKASAEL